MEKTLDAAAAYLLVRKHLHGRGEDYKRNFDGSQLWRNTSTDVEKTSAHAAIIGRRWKHLHGRGEDPVREDVTIADEGNTSTDVEKTVLLANRKSRRWKHLHGRGEDRESFYRWRRLYETPPRTWRRRIELTGNEARLRNTSTDVEKTIRLSGRATLTRKHLHGRGEDYQFKTISA